MPTISAEPVSAFLDAVDRVLNSNTFLLQTSLWSGGGDRYAADPPDAADPHDAAVKAELTAFITSDDFLKQLVQQDLEREWFNMHFFTAGEDHPTLKAGKLLKQPFDLKLRKADTDASAYLVGMLMADPRVGPFRSFYNKEKTREEAQILADDLITCLGGGNSPGSDTPGSAVNPPALYIIEPDFLVNGGEDFRADSDTLFYFEGPGACDTATWLIFGSQAYLLLTNGIP